MHWCGTLLVLHECIIHQRFSWQVNSDLCTPEITPVKLLPVCGSWWLGCQCSRAITSALHHLQVPDYQWTFVPLFTSLLLYIFVCHLFKQYANWRQQHLFLWKNEKSSLALVHFPNAFSNQHWARLMPETWNSRLGPTRVHRGRKLEAGRWTWYLNSGLMVWDVEIQSGVLASVPKLILDGIWKFWKELTGVVLRETFLLSSPHPTAPPATHPSIGGRWKGWSYRIKVRSG